MNIESAVYTQAAEGYRSHYHDSHLLLYVTHGAAEVAVGGRRFRAEAGSLVLISRLEEHSVVPLTEDYRRYVLRLRAGLEDRLSGILVNRAEGFRNVLRLPQAEPIMAALAAEFAADGPWQEEMLDALLRQLLVLVCRAMPGAVREDTPAAQVVRRIQKQFEENCAEKCSLSSLAEQHHISASYLCHVFRRETGLSVMDYLQACRLTMAKRLLATTDEPVGEIAGRCGFGDDSNFSRLFRRETGKTPRQFRRENRVG